VLGGVLLVGVALAAWISQSAGNARQEAAEILQRLREKGLTAYWPQEPPEAPTEHWYLVRGEEGAAGWEVARRWYQDGMYHGLHLMNTPKGLYWERWKIAPNLSAGDYRAGVFVQARGLGRALLPQPDTRIRLAQGGLDVWQTDPQTGEERSSRAANVPESYLPEGCWPAVRLLVARRRAAAQFQVIYNPQVPPPGSDEPRFVSAWLEYGGADMWGGQEARRVRERSLVQTSLLIDERGDVLRRSGPGGTTERIDRETLRRRRGSLEDIELAMRQIVDRL